MHYLQNKSSIKTKRLHRTPERRTIEPEQTDKTNYKTRTCGWRVLAREDPPDRPPRSLSSYLNLNQKCIKSKAEMYEKIKQKRE